MTSILRTKPGGLPKELMLTQERGSRMLFKRKIKCTGKRKFLWNCEWGLVRVEGRDR